MKNRKFWGWGWADFVVPEAHLNKYIPMLESVLGQSSHPILPEPDLESIDIRKPRIELPAALRTFCTEAKFDRLCHAYGKSYRDIWRALNGYWSNPPDYIAYPRSEKEVMTLLRFAEKHHVAVIPYGGGSSVCGGVEPLDNGHYKASITLNMQHFDQLLEVNVMDRTAVIQSGMYGPAIEAALKPHGLTLRHYPQSFEFSTLGGWIATRSGGHFAMQYTHIEEFVQSVRMVTPAGVVETRPLPSHGAGPSEERFYCGSEGAFGIITQASMRLQDMPKYKSTQVIRFETFEAGVEACRQISQSGLNPSNARLVDPIEAFSNGLGDGQHAILILGFESHLYPMEPKMEEGIKLAQQCQGKIPARQEEKDSGREAGAWKKSFFLAPYLRDELIRRGIIIETFETCVTWRDFESFHQELLKTANAAIKTHCGAGMITTRFTHLYPDGPAPYYTILARGNYGKQLEQWDAIKAEVSEKIVSMGGPITHHHAVGKEHRPYYEIQRSGLFGDVLQAAKKTLDPSGIMNPGTLIAVSEDTGEEG